MKALFWSCAVVLALVVSVESLKCYTCDASFLGYCTISDQIICSSGQGSCYSGLVSLSGIAEELHSKGCIATGSCKNTSQSLFGNININLTQTVYCCTTDLCNRAGPGLTPLALGSALGAVLLALGMNFSL